MPVHTDIQDYPGCIRNSDCERWYNAEGYYTGWFGIYRISWPVEVSERNIDTCCGRDNWRSVFAHPGRYNTAPLSSPLHIPAVTAIQKTPRVYCAPDPVCAVSMILQRNIRPYEKSWIQERENFLSFMHRFSALSMGAVTMDCLPDPDSLQEYLESVLHLAAGIDPNSMQYAGDIDIGIAKAAVKNAVRCTCGCLSTLYGAGSAEIRRKFFSGGIFTYGYRTQLVFFLTAIVNRYFNRVQSKMLQWKIAGRERGMGPGDLRWIPGPYLDIFTLYTATREQRRENDDAQYPYLFRTGMNINLYSIMDIMSFLLKQEMVSAGISVDKNNIVSTDYVQCKGHTGLA